MKYSYLLLNINYIKYCFLNGKYTIIFKKNTWTLWFAQGPKNCGTALRGAVRLCVQPAHVAVQARVTSVWILEELVSCQLPTAACRRQEREGAACCRKERSLLLAVARVQPGWVDLSRCVLLREVLLVREVQCCLCVRCCGVVQMVVGWERKKGEREACLCCLAAGIV